MTESKEPNKPINESKEHNPLVDALQLLLNSKDLSLTDSEKAALNNILRRIRPTQQTQNTTVAEHELTDPEQKLITEALEVILKTPHITFSVFGIGNVLAQPNGDKHGGVSYSLDRDRKKMGYSQGIGARELDSSPSTDKNFVENWRGQTIDGTFYVICRLPFSPSGNTRYCDDFRSGVHFTIALGLKGNYDNSTDKYNSSIPDYPELEAKISKLETGFISKIMKECAEKFIPEYFAYIKSLVNKWDTEHPNNAERSELFKTSI